MADIFTDNQLILHKTVVMVGMMGAGKTAVGRLLATRLNVPFCDSDHEIEEAANMTISEIFARDGEPFFRRKETQVIERLLEGTPCILSTGGGAFMSDENRAMITEKGASVWLQADLEVLWNRVRNKDTRPLLRTDNPRATLQSLYEARVPVYQLADLAVSSEASGTLDDMAQKTAQALITTRPDVLEAKS
ncbi:MAG: shikimate kinase [Pelagimonas sp.]|jgi:shikimate kinase|nr:shikimate kinase [Pelagimonas sp.]